MDVRVLGGDDWRGWREIRLAALRESPEAFGSTYARERDFGEDQWRSRLEDPSAVSVLASAAERSVGMAAGFQDLPGFLHVVAMWVAPTWRGRGVSHALLAQIESWADARGRRLHLDVSITNLAARHSYERFGFVATGETSPLREGSADLKERMVLERGAQSPPTVRSRPELSAQ